MATTALIVDVDRVTGAYITGWTRCRQSIETIVTTRLRTRVMRLWWGCNFLDQMDKPMNQITFAAGIVAVCSAINRYEPEFQVSSVKMTRSADGTSTCTVAGTYLPDQSAASLTVTLG